MLHATIFTVILLRAGFRLPLAVDGRSGENLAAIEPSRHDQQRAAPRPASRTNTAAGARSCPTPQTRTSSSEHGANGLGSRPRPRDILSRPSSSIPGMLEHGKASASRITTEVGCPRSSGSPTREANGRKRRTESGALLQQWKTWLVEDSNRAKAEQCLAEVSDPRAVPAISSVFAAGRAGTRSWPCNSWDRFRVQRRHAGWRCWLSPVFVPRYAVRQWKHFAGATRSSSPIC